MDVNLGSNQTLFILFFDGIKGKIFYSGNQFVVAISGQISFIMQSFHRIRNAFEKNGAK